MSRRVLITGASIAANTAALCLGRQGFDVTVLDQAAEFRDGGQNIDIRGVGREALRRLGLEAEALARGTSEEGTAWVDEDGKIVAAFTTDQYEGDGPTAEMEILRGDLARLLYEPAREHAEFRFGTKVTDVVEQDDALTVTFADNRTEQFEALIVAEGVGSSTRELIFPGENEPRWMDLTIGYFTIPRTADDDHLWRWYNATGGRGISLRPDTHGTTRAMLSIQQPSNGEHEWDVEKQKAFLKEQFADAGWQAERVLAAMQTTEDFYFDALRQVRMQRWSSGRVVLTGDAAWCATPLAGVGATLAVTGSYVLAGEMARTSDLKLAFSRYEAAMRPMVEQGQNVPKIGPRLMNPHSRLGISLLHGVLGIASRPSLQQMAATAFSRPLKEPDLSPYA